MGAPWRQWPAAYGEGNAIYRREAAGCDRGEWPRRRDRRAGDPDRSAGRWDSTGGRAHGRAPEETDAARAPRWIDGAVPCACA